jgi:hypothetical protein
MQVYGIQKDLRYINVNLGTRHLPVYPKTLLINYKMKFGQRTK